MSPEEIATEIKAILDIDVSWRPHDHDYDEVPWTVETEKPAPWCMGIDDLGDAMDYIEGVRGRLIKLMKRLAGESCEEKGEQHDWVRQSFASIQCSKCPAWAVA